MKSMEEMEEQDLALKILHTADWHLGLSFSRFDEEDRTKLTRARLEAVDKLLGLAESYQVDAVLCAGDIFDEPAPQDQWWRELVRLFERRKWTNRPVFLLPGNHDPLWPTSVWAKDHAFRRALPGWVHVVDCDDFEYRISDEAVLYAVPCRSQAGADDLTARLPQRQAGDQRIRIGMGHGQTFDLKNHQTNFPIAADAAQRSGLNYLAIGDTHAFREFPPKTSPMVYPGAPETTEFGETDTGHVAIVFFPRSGRPPSVTKERVARWTWRQECCSSMAALEALRQQDLKDCVLKLTFSMQADLRERERVDAILQELKGTEVVHGKVGVLLLDRAGIQLKISDHDDFEDELPEVLKSVVARLKEQSEGTDGDIARRALYHLYQTVKALPKTARAGGSAQ